MTTKITNVNIDTTTITSVGTLSSLTVTSTITGNISGSAGTATTAGTVTTAAQPNITSVGTLASLGVTANISSGNASLGNLTTSNYFAGVLTTSAQPNITSVGSLTGLTVSNASGVVNLVTTANVSLGAIANVHITGGTTGQYIKTDGAGNLSFTTVTVPDPLNPFLLAGM